jgi:serine/threonine protein phosphatase PrpC
MGQRMNAPREIDDSSDSARWCVIATCMRGTHHAATDMPCQDAVHWQENAHGFLFAAVADGAGSALLAEIGAQTAARQAVGTLLAADRPLPGANAPEEWKQLLMAVLHQALEAVEAEAALRQSLPRDLASTLIVLAASSEMVAAAQIGDGAVVVEDAEGKLRALTVPQNGEFANETTFLVSPDALAQAQFAFLSGASLRLAVFSDGLQRLALDTTSGTPHPPFFRPLFRFAAEATDTKTAEAELTAFFASPRIAGRTDDDLTLLLAHRTG